MLVILGAAFGVMFATLTTLMITSIRLQHRDNLQTRIETRSLIAQSTEKLVADIDRRFDKQEAKFDKRFDKQEGKLDKVVTSLSDARERLARIEGHLGIESPSQTEPESNGDTSEAA
ncbi:MAG: hypothetical protein OXB92_11845 [Acidimicrobiaceae bacterium]|nr:hypothetical protein [Acidimicrobiia bacterium]MCY4494538.1 hypothetical protein [Acidimicrobiaceae bacterium]